MTPNRRSAHNVRSARRDRSQIWRLARPRMALTGQWHQRKFDRWCHPLYAKKGTCRAGNASDYKIDGTRGHLISNRESLATSNAVCMIYDLAFAGTQKCQELHAIEPMCYFVLQHRVKYLLVIEGSQKRHYVCQSLTSSSVNALWVSSSWNECMGGTPPVTHLPQKANALYIYSLATVALK